MALTKFSRRIINIEAVQRALNLVVQKYIVHWRNQVSSRDSFGCIEVCVLQKCTIGSIFDFLIAGASCIFVMMG
jgi:hypothetical protein